MATETLRPNADGTTVELYDDPDEGAGKTYMAVDEVSADDETTRVYAWEDVYRTSTFEIPDHSVGSGTINHVKVYIRSSMTTASTGKVKVTIYTHSTLYYGNEESIEEDNWENFSKQWDINPNTESAWTWDEVDALEIGTSNNNDTEGHGCATTQVYVEVDYTEAVTYQPRPSGMASGTTQIY